MALEFGKRFDNIEKRLDKIENNLNDPNSPNDPFKFNQSDNNKVVSLDEKRKKSNEDWGIKFKIKWIEQ